MRMDELHPVRLRPVSLVVSTPGQLSLTDAAELMARHCYSTGGSYHAQSHWLDP